MTPALRKGRLSYERRKKWIGFSFIVPWLIGCLTFFLRPFLDTLRYSLSNVKILDEGVAVTFAGLKNYAAAFAEDENFLPLFLESMGDTVFQVPVVLLFSLFVGVILNQEFRGRTFFRAVFFMPVIIASGVVISLIRGDGYSDVLLGGGMLFQASSFETLLLKAGMHEELVNAMMMVINNIFELSWKSGVQILIFLAGFKTISPALYEVAKIEGANAWETFWKVTIPLLSPVIIVNLIYTIVDTFSDYLNPMIVYIQDNLSKLNVAYASAMAWIYFLSVLAITAVVMAVVSRKAFSYN